MTRLLDEVSTAIIGALQQDGRRSYASIGHAVGLSAATAHRRVQDLINRRVLRIVAVTDPRRLGLTRRAVIGLRAAGEVEPVADSVAKIAEVRFVVITAGSFDILAEVVCENDEHLLEVLSQKIRNVENVVSTETFTDCKFQAETCLHDDP